MMLKFVICKMEALWICCHICVHSYFMWPVLLAIYIYVHTIIEGVSYRILQQHCHFSVI